MARFLGSVLRYLGSGYQIAGSEVRTDQLDLGAVQLVQDVSSLVSSGRGPGLFDGWYIAAVGLDLAGNQASRTAAQTVNPRANPGGTITWWPQGALGDEYDVYLYGMTGEFIVEDASVSPALTSARGWAQTPARYPIQQSGLIGTPQDDIHLLGDASGSSYLAAFNSVRNSLAFNRPTTRVLRLPMFLPLGTVLVGRAAMTGDGTGGTPTAAVTRINFLLRAVPRGFPPGP
jgi:hypothetical protein